MSKNKTRTKDKYRVVYNDTQRIELENEFRLNEYIAIPRKQEIAHKLQLSERQIKIWFQNRRAKKRKQQKRRSSSNPNTTSITTTDVTNRQHQHPLTHQHQESVSPVTSGRIGPQSSPIGADCHAFSSLPHQTTELQVESTTQLYHNLQFGQQHKRRSSSSTSLNTQVESSVSPVTTGSGGAQVSPSMAVDHLAAPRDMQRVGITTSVSGSPTANQLYHHHFRQHQPLVPQHHHHLQQQQQQHPYHRQAMIHHHNEQQQPLTHHQHQSPLIQQQQQQYQHQLVAAQQYNSHQTHHQPHPPHPNQQNHPPTSITNGDLNASQLPDQAMTGAHPHHQFNGLATADIQQRASSQLTPHQHLPQHPPQPQLAAGHHLNQHNPHTHHHHHHHHHNQLMIEQQQRYATAMAASATTTPMDGNLVTSPVLSGATTLTATITTSSSSNNIAPATAVDQQSCSSGGSPHEQQRQQHQNHHLIASIDSNPYTNYYSGAMDAAGASVIYRGPNLIGKHALYH